MKGLIGCRNRRVWTVALALWTSVLLVSCGRGSDTDEESGKICGVVDRSVVKGYVGDTALKDGGGAFDGTFGPNGSDVCSVFNGSRTLLTVSVVEVRNAKDYDDDKRKILADRKSQGSACSDMVPYDGVRMGTACIVSAREVSLRLIDHNANVAVDIYSPTAKASAPIAREIAVSVLGYWESADK